MAGRGPTLRRWATTLQSNAFLGNAPSLQNPRKAPDIPKTERSSRRFWKTVNVHTSEDGHRVRLDERPLRTPLGKALLLPKNKTHLAYLVAAEWNALESAKIKPHSLPITSIAARAIDFSEPAQRQEIIKDLLKYLDTDTLLCYAPSEEYDGELRKEQIEISEPIRKWASELFGAEISAMDGQAIVPHYQTREAKDNILTRLVETLTSFQTAGFERAVLASKSFLTGLALVCGRLSVEDAARGASLETKYQTRRWGEVEDTHDVDHADLRQQLGSAHCAIINEPIVLK